MLPRVKGQFSERFANQYIIVRVEGLQLGSQHHKTTLKPQQYIKKNVKGEILLHFSWIGGQKGIRDKEKPQQASLFQADTMNEKWQVKS